ncbi:MAG: DUF4232 domain-containing protein [Streptosporangiaceae bacterium]
MNLRSSALRRCAAAALACAAISVPAVALASPAVPRSVVSLPRCPAANTYVWFALSPNGTAGSVVYPVEFTNVGRRTCTLRGIPSIWAVSKSGRRIGPAARKITVTARTVTVRPNQTVHALLSIVEPGVIAGCRAATAYGLEVRPPGQKRSQFVGDFTFTTCKNKVALSIEPVARGIGVP